MSFSFSKTLVTCLKNPPKKTAPSKWTNQNHHLPNQRRIFRLPRLCWWIQVGSQVPCCGGEIPTCQSTSKFPWRNCEGGNVVFFTYPTSVFWHNNNGSPMVIAFLIYYLLHLSFKQLYLRFFNWNVSCCFFLAIFQYIPVFTTILFDMSVAFSMVWKLFFRPII